MRQEALNFLTKLLGIPTPPGFEHQIQELLKEELSSVVDEAKIDVIGNLSLVKNPGKASKLMFVSHADEIGLMVRYITDEGFIFFSGGSGLRLDSALGQRVIVLGKDEAVPGVICGRPSKDAERKAKDFWIDIGAKNKKAAGEVVTVGDPIVYEQNLAFLPNGRAIARGFDNKIGCFILSELMRVLEVDNTPLTLYTVFSVQEEIGSRGIQVDAFDIFPKVGVVVDVIEATDYPGADKREMGEIDLDKGPVIYRGPNINPLLFGVLADVAKKIDINFQIFGEPASIPNDAGVLQLTKSGVATVVVSIPVRYPHTPGGILSLADVEKTIQLLTAFVRALGIRVDFLSV